MSWLRDIYRRTSLRLVCLVLLNVGLLKLSVGSLPLAVDCFVQDGVDDVLVLTTIAVNGG